MNKGHDKGHKGQMSDREVMRLALEALENWMRIDTVEDMHIFEMVTAPEAIAALHQALEQPEQEPIHQLSMRTGPTNTAWIDCDEGTYNSAALLPNEYNVRKLYTAPPKREWVGLTDEEIFDVIRSLCADNETAEMLIHVSMDEYRAIEAKLKEKNK